MKRFFAILLMALMVCTLFTACAGGGTTTDEPAEPADPKDALVGEWEYQSGGYTYTFNADGTGTYDAGGTLMEFTYTAEDGKLSILYTGNTAPMELNYEINGTVLNVKDSFDNDTLYNKK